MAQQAVNRRIVVSARPRYNIPNTDSFSLASAPAPKPKDGEVLVRTTWLGIEPYLYGRVKQTSKQNPPVALGDTMVGPTVGRVEVSCNRAYKEGDIVEGAWGWQDYHVSDGTDLTHVDTGLPRPSYALGAFGRSGFAAYVAINEYLKVKKGETLIFGAALGGLGQMIRQLRRMRRARTIGGVSGDKKRCGVMSFYSAPKLPAGPDRTLFVFKEINLKRISVHGLVVLDWFGTPTHEQFKKDMKAWILDGRIKVVEHIVDGLQNASDTLQGLFEGRNFGKAVVRVSD